MLFFNITFDHPTFFRDEGEIKHSIVFQSQFIKAPIDKYYAYFRLRIYTSHQKSLLP